MIGDFGVSLPVTFIVKQTLVELVIMVIFVQIIPRLLPERAPQFKVA